MGSSDLFRVLVCVKAFYAINKVTLFPYPYFSSNSIQVGLGIKQDYKTTTVWEYW